MHRACHNCLSSWHHSQTSSRLEGLGPRKCHHHGRSNPPASLGTAKYSDLLDSWPISSPWDFFCEEKDFLDRPQIDSNLQNKGPSIWHEFFFSCRVCQQFRRQFKTSSKRLWSRFRQKVIQRPESSFKSVTNSQLNTTRCPHSQRAAPSLRLIGDAACPTKPALSLSESRGMIEPMKSSSSTLVQFQQDARDGHEHCGMD